MGIVDRLDVLVHCYLKMPDIDYHVCILASYTKIAYECNTIGQIVASNVHITIIAWYLNTYASLHILLRLSNNSRVSLVNALLPY